MNRQEIFEYVKKQYGTVPEYLWETSPESAVLPVSYTHLVSADHGIKEASDKETVEVEFKDTTKTVKITDLYTEKEIQNLK